MYRTCNCEDFPCCGHGIFDTDYQPDINPWDDYGFDPYMYEDDD